MLSNTTNQTGDMPSRKVQSLNLEVAQYAVTGAVTRQMAEYGLQGIQASVEDLGENLLVKLTREVLAERRDPIVIQYPSTWREAFRERWWPTWAKTRWPIRYTIHTIQPLRLFPDLAVPAGKHVVKLEHWTTERCARIETA